MPALLAPGLWTLVVSAGLSLEYQAGVRAEARADQVRPAVGESTTYQSLEVEPRVGLEGWSPTLQLELAYAPRFTHYAGDGPDDGTWLQRAWAIARWRPTAAWQLRADGIATVGTVDLFRIATAPGQPGEPPPVGQAAPVASILDYQRYELASSAEGRLSRHLELRASLGAMREGGSNEAQREILPLQQSGHARLELERRFSGRTTLAGILAGSATHYFDVAVDTGGPDDPTHQSWSIWMARAEAVWRYALTSHTRVWAGAGLWLVDSHAPGAGGLELRPLGEIGLEREAGPGWPRLTGGVVAAAALIEDRLTGTIAQRAVARAWGAWSPTERWTLGASALGSRVLDGPTEREAFTAGDTWLTWAMRDIFSISAGGRWTTQWPAPLPGRTSLPDGRWTAYLSVQATHSSRREGPAPVESDEPIGPAWALTDLDSRPCAAPFHGGWACAGGPAYVHQLCRSGDGGQAPRPGRPGRRPCEGLSPGAGRK